MDTKSHDTPWGFTLEEAIEAFEFRRRVLSSPGEMELHRRKLLAEHPETVCAVADCEKPWEKDKKVVKMFPQICIYRWGVTRDKYCAEHFMKLWNFRNMRHLRSERGAYRRIALREAARVKAEREASLTVLDQTLRWREEREHRTWITAARKEYARPKKARVVPYTGPARKGYVYRLYDIENVLLYVGKTYNVHQRLFYNGGHAHKEWWQIVAEAEVEVFETEPEALEAEAHAIHTEKPKLNIFQPIPRTEKPPLSLARYRGWVSSEPVEPLRC